MLNVLVLGANGMLGSAVKKILTDHKNFTLTTTTRDGLGANYKFDVLRDKIDELISRTNPDYVINCIGVIKPRILESSPNSIEEAIRINSLFPHELNRSCTKVGARVIQIATDCVFSGKIGNYVEQSPHDALDIYGKSKSLGEVSSDNFLNLRVSIIGPEVGRSTSLLEWFLNQPMGASIHGYSNHFWNGISTFHYAKLVAGIMDNSTFDFGTQHILVAEPISKFTLLNFFKESYGRIDIEIQEVTAKETVNRTLSSSSLSFNSNIWVQAGYAEVPSLRRIVDEMRAFSDS